ncbi:MAG: FHA domain-containing protein [Planctomycetota bacterium]
MFQWRLKLREAGQALAAGRVDEARRLLDDEALRGFLPAKQLAGQVAERYAERARDRIARGESTAAMADLEAAQQLGAADATADAVRSEYAAAAAGQALLHLAAGEPGAAADRIDRAHRRGVQNQTLRGIRSVAAAWIESNQHAERGDMTAAQTQLSRAARLAKSLTARELTGEAAGHTAAAANQVGNEVARLGTIGLAETLDSAAQDLARRAESHHAEHERLNAAVGRQAWDEALTAVDACLRLAPADAVAIRLRRRLWKQVGLGLTQTHAGRRGPTPLALGEGRRLARSLREAAAGQAQPAGPNPPNDARQPTNHPSAMAHSPSSAAQPTDRRMLWIDAVGGFLVCLDDEVVLGQPAGGDARAAGRAAGAAAVPILADISRRHAVLRREAGAYVLQPLGEVAVDGAPITGPTVLGDENLIQLGGGPTAAGGVRLRFTRPHALSSTARLVVESGHRTAPAADAILLMADSCVLGPGAHSHVRCPGWRDDLILFRKPTGGRAELHCQSSAPLTVDGADAHGPTKISDGSRVEGEDFTLCVESA